MALQPPPPPPLPPPAVALIIAAGGIYTHASVDSNTNPKANGSKMSVESLLYMVATIAVAALLLVGVRSVIHWCIS
ncbi:Os06g0684400 [Oryza sativa Japonica Group]|uniref:Os06g0684400 protein n=1 Tax=Oryza sativa subsp. japonica TaxID=39947 RepID=A0A0P0X0M1_ORYSJ|nr:Os06g0684400 [Oryza sativa Japonica Group]